jgi:hypothetical protein
VLCFVQVGDGTSGTTRLTPVGVVGFGSGVPMIALGGVRPRCGCCVAVLDAAAVFGLIFWVDLPFL